MVERSYTVQEIDALRRVHKDKLVCGRYSGPVGDLSASWGFNPQEMEKQAEDRVRTSMLAGHTAEDLLASEREAM